MKAATWRNAAPGAVFAVFAVLAIALAGSPHAGLAQGALPAGLPELPALGEAMQRDLRSGLALGGRDPVAYRTDGAALPGEPEHELAWRGAIWRFRNAANLAAFQDAPALYEPAFAGFDPTGVADGRVIDGDPHHFALAGGRLLLFRTQESRARYLGDPSLHARAIANWDEVKRLFAR